MVFVLFIVLPLLTPFELIDYSNEHYALIPIDMAYFYRETGTLFRIFNVTNLREKLSNYLRMRYEVVDTLEDRKLTLLMGHCQELIDQLTIHRSRRGLNFLGTAIKFVTGMPDHNDILP